MSQEKLSLKGLNFQATKIEENKNILTITLNRPEKKNALNNVMVNEICYALAYAKQERSVICKIQGSVLAGALLMVTNSTHAIAIKEAKFSAPEILRGLWPHMVMAGLFRVMPKRAGLDYIMRGQSIDASKAKEWGLINDFVEKEQLDEHVKNLSEELSNLAPGTMQFGFEAYEKQDAMAFDEALPFLQKQIAKTFEGPDAKEGIAAFLEKRKPDWDK